MKNFIMRLIVFVIFFISFCSIYAQSFIVNDVQFGSEIPNDRQQRVLEMALGAQIDIQVFDNYIKLTFHDKDKEEVAILKKVNTNRYEYMDNRGEKLIVELNVLLSYIRSITFSVYQDNKLQGKYMTKRK